MGERVDVCGNVRNIIGSVFGVLGCLFRSTRLMLLSKAVLARLAQALPEGCGMTSCTGREAVT